MLPFELPELPTLTAEQVFALAIIGLVVGMLVLTGGITLWLYFTERELRTTFPKDYVPEKPNYEPTEPRLPDPLSAAPRIAIGTLIGVILAALGIGAAQFTRLLFPAQGSLEAVQIDALFDAMFAIAVVIFLFVEGVLLFVALRYRAKKDDLTDAKPIHGNTTLEIIWTVVPAILVTWLAIYSFNVLQQVQDERQVAFNVQVVGFQFGWRYEYPHMRYTATDALYLPAYTDVRLVLRSQDVIHSFWVPAFRLKRDAMPNLNTEMYVMPLAPGEYEIRCAELCGSGHSQMNSRVIVLDDIAWAAWEQENGVFEDVVLTPYEEGRQLFINNGCTGCHVLDDVNSVGAVGPTLNGIGNTAETRVAGQSAEEYIRRSIVAPNEYLVEGYVANLMPQNYGDLLTDEQLDLLVNYLLEQK